MEDKEYKYDAFISYRHCDLDKFVAENLHKILESYELPKNIKEKLNINGKTIKRVFRDQDELPLSSNLEDPIIEALKNSKYLIVICSPRLKDSLWCKKEIETFKKIRGRKNIFCVLVEGEPSDSFPKEVLFDEIEKKEKNGKIIKEKKLVEPLALDVRGTTKKEILKKLKEEKLRLIAPMYNLDYDDLKQRHKQRRQRKIMITSVVVAVTCILFTLYTSIMLIKINSQQNTLKLYQAQSLSRMSNEYLNKDNRYDAIKSSYQALTEFDNVKMPYTPEAEYTLLESLGMYDVGSSYKAVSQLKTNGVATIIKSSNDNKYALVYDESDEITLFSTKTLKKIKTFDVSGVYITENSFSFIGNDLFSYITKDGNINLINNKDGKLVKEIKKEKEKYISVRGDIDGKYLSYTDQKKLYVYDIKEDKIKGNIETEDKILKEMYFSSENNYLFVFTTNDNFDINKEDYITVHVININDIKEINKVTINAGYISGVLTKNDNAYMLLNKIIGTDYSMIVVSYNFIDGNINWTKNFDNSFGKFITKSYPDGTNDIAVVNYETVNVLDADTGDIIKTFDTDNEVIDIYSYLNKEIYLVFLKNGEVNYINMEYKNNVEYKGKFEFNLDEYIKVSLSENGFLLIPNKENRVILYEEKTNKNMKKEDIKIDYIKDDSIKLSDYDKVKEEYNIKNKSLVDKIFYDTKKEILFVNYTNEDISIYDVKSKKLLKTLKEVGKVNHYFGKDKYNRIYIGDVSNSYILDKNYQKIGHIKSLCKLEKDKVIIKYNSNYYSLPIYTLDDILKEAKEYLK